MHTCRLRAGAWMQEILTSVYFMLSPSVFHTSFRMEDLPLAFIHCLFFPLEGVTKTNTNMHSPKTFLVDTADLDNSPSTWRWYFDSRCMQGKPPTTLCSPH